MLGLYEIVFDDRGRERVFQVVAGNRQGAMTASRAVSAARQMKLRRIRFVGAVRFVKRRVKCISS